MSEKKACCTPAADRAVGLSPVKNLNQRRSGRIDRGQMQQLAGGTFRMGSAAEEAWPEDGEGPVRNVTVRPFLIDRYAVTNAAFAEFVSATGYITDAEQYGWSFVFHLHLTKAQRKELHTTRSVVGLEWWLAVPGATWKMPFGSGSDSMCQEQHPVVHVTWNDATQFAKWAGKRLLTEAEWEFGARGGLDQKLYPLGNSIRRKGRYLFNIFQGEFPGRDTGKDGYKGTCPVDEFEPNGFELYNMVGNVWEWCQDWFDPDYHRLNPALTDNPVGPPSGTRRVQRGGSYLCHDSYCNRYRVSARLGNTPDSSGSNVGFRCAADLS